MGVQPSLPVQAVTYDQLWANQQGVFLDKFREVQILDTNSGNKKEWLKTSAIVLGLFSILAAAGAITFFMFAGGPSNFQFHSLLNRLHLFIPSLVLGAGSLGLTTWLVVMVCKEMHILRKMEKSKTDTSSKSVAFQEMLLEFEKPRIKEENIKSALSGIKPDQQNGNVSSQRQQLFQCLHDQYFSQEGQILNEQQKKVLSACAHFYPDIEQLPIENLSREFGMHMLTYLPSSILANEDNDLLVRLLRKVGIPSETETAVFSCFPRHVADLACEKNDFNLTPEIYAKMNAKQKVIFLQRMDQARTLLQPDDGDKLTRIYNIIMDCSQQTFSDDFVRNFQDMTRPPKEHLANSEEIRTQPNIIEDQEKLLLELAKWPRELGLSIYCCPENNLQGEAKIIRQFERYLTPEQKETLINVVVRAANAFPHPQNIGNEIKKWLEFYANQELPHLTKLIYTRLPEVLAYANEGLSEAAKAKIDELLIEVFNDKDSGVRFLETEKRVNSDGFKQRMDQQLSILNSSAIAYLKKHPEDFKTLVLENISFGEHFNDRCNQILKVMEAMEESVEKPGVFDKIDSGVGYSNYNALMLRLNAEISNKLIDLQEEAFTRWKNNRNDSGELPPSGSDALNLLPESFKLLVARFKKKAGQKSIVPLAKNAIEAKGNEWEDFNQIASLKEAEVWLNPSKQ
jgi:hypothetical protein